ncbi:unnamed protein product [Cyprideis torosa]|uniref:Uncharacterized protein n=1 Tax=Cyprideis torosa TaxID=163714 RepID=A0A7R8WAT9_9CRUS|nr:unnamed protein product [Cyprideis torosa]CAG0891420.1 unnamed protein product [Cyprideis torosa]
MRGFNTRTSGHSGYKKKCRRSKAIRRDPASLTLAPGNLFKQRDEAHPLSSVSLQVLPLVLGLSLACTTVSSIPVGIDSQPKPSSSETADEILFPKDDLPKIPDAEETSSENPEGKSGDVEGKSEGEDNEVTSSKEDDLSGAEFL